MISFKHINISKLNTRKFHPYRNKRNQYFITQILFTVYSSQLLSSSSGLAKEITTALQSIAYHQLGMQAQASQAASQKKKAGKCSLSITFHTYSSCARKYIFSGPASLNYKLKECCLPLLMWQNRELHILDLIYL